MIFLRFCPTVSPSGVFFEKTLILSAFLRFLFFGAPSTFCIFVQMEPKTFCIFVQIKPKTFWIFMQMEPKTFCIFVQKSLQKAEENVKHKLKSACKGEPLKQSLKNF